MVNIIDITKQKLEIMNSSIGYGQAYRRFLIQKESEWIEFDNFLSNHKPFNYGLEIGTHSGGTLIELINISEEDATLITIDNGNGHFDNLNDKIKAFNAIKKENQKIYCVLGLSQSDAVIDESKNILNGNFLDYLFIDGDHSYDGVKQDFDNYSPLVKKGGIIAFHDIYAFGVKKLWPEIKDNYEHHEIYDKTDLWGGIGVLIK